MITRGGTGEGSQLTMRFPLCCSVAAFSVGVSLLDGATPVVMSSPAAQETSLNISTGAAAELATALDTPIIVRKVRTESRHVEV
jgi:hypothetical protein